MNYYVVCPYGLITGGPDALHQLVYYLNSINKSASIVYDGINERNKEIPGPYKCYLNNYKLLQDVEDNKDNTIIFPEIYGDYYTKKFKKATVYIWWVSVDNYKSKVSLLHKIYLGSTFFVRLFKWMLKKENLKDKIVNFKYNLFFKIKFNQKNLSHLCASYYSYSYVSKKAKNKCKLCIEPISKIFLDNENILRKRTDIVIYNPRKSKKWVEILKKNAADIKFVPLTNLSQGELIEIYQTAKVYIDFGPFPGAERMPKEAVVNGCLIITGRFGASNYYGDVPIYDEYKFKVSKKLINNIIAKIRFCLANYDSIIDDFKDYRETVNNLEKNFINSIKNI